MGDPVAVGTTISLLGRPRIARTAGDVYKFRSRKSWALLAYLILSDRPPTRSQMVSLLFADADDPIRALRWSLAEIRRSLDDDGSVSGDPLVLQLAPDAVADVNVVIKSAWVDAVRLPGLGAELLEGMAIRGAAAFETWLLSQQRRVAAATEAILHEAALGSMSQGALEAASGYAVRAAAMSPLDENPYLGAVESDRASYRLAVDYLDQAVALARQSGERRREAYALALLGRISLFRGALDAAAEQLDASIRLAEREHWLTFLPWPQSFRGEVQLARNDLNGAAEVLQQAFARACHVGDPCWEGASARALAMLAAMTGDVDRAFVRLADARVRCNRLSDPYVWLDGYILDAQCQLGVRHGHPDTAMWVGALRDLASRTGMRELALRSLEHRTALGDDGAAAAATLLAADIEAAA
jgi:tetratricopeptide (TPR) repeat protein